MITKFSGNRYNFEIRRDGFLRSTFSITAISKDTGRYSSINNLNYILSELGVDIYNQKYDDSMWVLSNKESKKFKKIVKQNFSSDSFIKYLEGKLDEDRMCGEWANILGNNN